MGHDTVRPKKKRPKSIIIGRHSAGGASLCPPRYSPTHHLTGRRQALRPALRLREPLRAGAVRQARPDDAGHPPQESQAGTPQFPCHILTATHSHSPATMPAPTPPHLPHARAQAARTLPRASHTHTMRPCSLRVRPCGVRLHVVSAHCTHNRLRA